MKVFLDNAALLGSIIGTALVLWYIQGQLNELHVKVNNLEMTEVCLSQGGVVEDHPKELWDRVCLHNGVPTVSWKLREGLK